LRIGRSPEAIPNPPAQQVGYHGAADREPNERPVIATHADATAIINRTAHGPSQVNASHARRD